MAAGIDITQFWKLTPFQTRTVTVGVQRDRRHWSIFQAYYTAAIDRSDGAKNPRVKDLDYWLADEREQPIYEQPAQDPGVAFGKLFKMAQAKNPSLRRRGQPAEQNADG